MTVPVPAGAGGVDRDQVRPSDVLIVGARITPAVIGMVQDVEQALVAAVRAEGAAALAAAEQGVADAEGKIAALREHTLESNPALRQLHDAAVAYVDAREALAEVRGGPLSTTLGYLIRAGYLVPASPSVTEVNENFRLIDRVKAAEQRADTAEAESAERDHRAYEHGISIGRALMMGRVKRAKQRIDTLAAAIESARDLCSRHCLPLESEPTDAQ